MDRVSFFPTFSFAYNTDEDTPVCVGWISHALTAYMRSYADNDVMR